MGRQPSPRPSWSTPVETFTATISRGGREFPFELHYRRLRPGEFSTIQYYWMNNAHFRWLGAGSSSKNFQNCVDLWITASRLDGMEDDPVQQSHALMAQCYPLVSRSRAMQNIYRDAYLKPAQIDASAEPLPNDVLSRIRNVVESRDRFSLQHELDQLLKTAPKPPARIEETLHDVFEVWMGRGVQLMRSKGREGVARFLAEIESRMKQYRKESGNVWVRHFINRFSYEAKSDFYLCYASAWLSLIPWIKEHRGLDDVSERFLSTWHQQNQPVELAPESLIGDVRNPGQGQAQARDGALSQSSVAPPPGPTHLRDVFYGQVLSLHPLSGFFMKDPKLCAAAEAYFATDPMSETGTQASIDYEDAYWNFIGAVLSAAYSYRLALDQQNVDRKEPPRKKTTPKSGRKTRVDRKAEAPKEEPSQEDQTTTEASTMEDFAARLNARCPHCRGELSFVSLEKCGEGAEYFDVLFTCPACQKQVTVPFPSSEFKEWLSPTVI